MSPTMDDVAKAANVSRSLVSLVFQDSPKVSPQSRRKVLKAAEKLGYRPNALARRLASRRSNTVGVLLNDLHNPFYAGLHDGTADAAADAGAQLLLAAGDRTGEREARAIEMFLEQQVEGVVLLGPRLPGPRLAQLLGATPAVVVGRDPGLPGVDAVMNDEEHGARLAVDHLVSLGHRRILHVAGGRSAAGAVVRHRSYVAAMEAHGLAEEADVISADFTEEAGARAARTLLQRHALPTAVLAANDACAVGLMSRLTESGVRIPEDVSLVGYDDTTLAQIGMIALTTVRQPLERMGRRAFELLWERLEGRREGGTVDLVEPTLVTRRTTGSPRD